MHYHLVLIPLPSLIFWLPYVSHCYVENFSTSLTENVYPSLFFFLFPIFSFLFSPSVDSGLQSRICEMEKSKYGEKVRGL
jgi:hypothetical protein